MQEIDVYDIQSSWHKGINSLYADEGTYYLGLNVYLEDKKICTGWGIDLIRELNLEGRYVGGLIYKIDNKQFLIVGVGGKLYLIDLPSLNIVGEIGRYNIRAKRLWFCKVHNFVIIQDGVNRPIVLNENCIVEDHNVPRGTIMHFVHNRLFVKTDKYAIEASDFYLPYSPSNFLKFKERTYLAGGGALGVPEDLGEITALGSLATPETGSGQGYLLVFTVRGIVGFATFQPRITWSDVDLSKVLVWNSTTLSDRSLININSDIVYQTPTGVCSLGVAKQYMNSLIMPADLSHRARSLFIGTTDWATKFSSAAVWGNNVVFTVIPRKRTVIDYDKFERDEFYFKALACFNISPNIIENSFLVPESLIADKDEQFENDLTINQVFDNGYVIGRKANGRLCLARFNKRTLPKISYIQLNEVALTKGGNAYYIDYVNKRKLYSINMDLSDVMDTTEIELYVRDYISKEWGIFDSRRILISKDASGDNFGISAEGVKFTNRTPFVCKKFDLGIKIKGECKINNIIEKGRTLPSEVDTKFEILKTGLTFLTNCVYR